MNEPSVTAYALVGGVYRGASRTIGDEAATLLFLGGELTCAARQLLT